MDTEVVVWTAIFLGGDLMAVILLLFWAVKKDREKRARTGDATEG